MRGEKNWTCRGRCKYKIMAEEGPTARFYISLLTHLSASLSCLQSTDNNPYALCCRSFQETPLPSPQLDVLQSSDRPPGHSSNPLVLAKGLCFAFAPCEGVVVKWEVRNSRVSGTTPRPCQGHLQPSEQLILLKHSELRSLHLVDKSSHADVVKHVQFIIFFFMYLFLTPSRSHLLHHMQGKYLLLHKGMRGSVARD